MAMKIASGANHSVAVTEMGRVLVCGQTIFGASKTLQQTQSLGSISAVKKFQAVDTISDFRIQQVACGDYHTVCLSVEGELVSWGGAANSKMFKRPSIKDTSVENSILRPLTGRLITDISCGDFHTLALDQNGQVWSWGGGQQHNKGQCGHGNFETVEKPKAMVFFYSKKVTMIAAGGYHSLAVTQD